MIHRASSSKEITEHFRQKNIEISDLGGNLLIAGLYPT